MDAETARKLLARDPVTDEDAGPPPKPETLTILVIRTAEDVEVPDLVAMIEASHIGDDPGTRVEAIKRPYGEITANDHGRLRDLGFTFEQANAVATVAWSTE